MNIISEPIIKSVIVFVVYAKQLDQRLVMNIISSAAERC